MSTVPDEPEDGVTVGGFDTADIEPVYQPIVDLRDGRRRRLRGARPRARRRRALARGAVRRGPRAGPRRGARPRVPRGRARWRASRRASARRSACSSTPTPARWRTTCRTRRAPASRSSWRSPSGRSPSARSRCCARSPSCAGCGWGVALDDVGADSRSLALMPVLYPDVIKLDLRLLRDREPDDVARIVTAVGAEAEKRLATVLAEGIDSEEQLATARAAGATLGQGYLLGEPAPLPDELPEPGRGLRLTSSGGVPENAVPYQRVTNWRRPARGPARAGRAHRRDAVRPGRRARQHRPAARRHTRRRPLPPAQLAATAHWPPRSASSACSAARRRARGTDPRRPAAGGRPAARHLDRGRARPGLRRLLRRPPRGGRQLALRDLLRPRDRRRVRGRPDGADALARRRWPARRCAPSSAITFESWPPCQASGDAPGSSETSRAPGIASA